MELQQENEELRQYAEGAIVVRGASLSSLSAATCRQRRVLAQDLLLSLLLCQGREGAMGMCATLGCCWQQRRCVPALKGLCPSKSAPLGGRLAVAMAWPVHNMPQQRC